MWVFIFFSFEQNYDVLKSKSPCFLLNKYMKLNTSETESKMENPMHNLDSSDNLDNLCPSSFKNRELKVKP